MIEKNIGRDSFIWNMIGSMLMAFQSVIMLVILTRTVGLVEAGIFTIAYANANLFMTIGKYGMRHFQISDVKRQFNFVDYKMSRIVTAVAMIMISLLYIIYSAINKGYSENKILIIIWMCLFKLIDVLEDVYHGLYQQKNRLDIASKALALRMIITIFTFGISLIILKNLLVSLIISTIITTILFLLFTAWTYPEFNVEKTSTSKQNVFLLMKMCFPLFAGSFLSFYIGNAPKYAIDARLTDELQACYGFIAMPVFVIGLLNNFIFNPLLFSFSVLWEKREIKKFVFKTIRQICIVLVITAICIIGAYLIGVPVLSMLYSEDLATYKKELLILLLGGGFLGMSGLLQAIITIIRYQKFLIWGYILVSILAYVFSGLVVEKYGILGAATLYTSLMCILCILFCSLFMFAIVHEKRKKILL